MEVEVMLLTLTPAEAQSLRTPLTTRRLGEGELGEVAALRLLN